MTPNPTSENPFKVEQRKCDNCGGTGYTTDGGRNEFGNPERLLCCGTGFYFTVIWPDGMEDSTRFGEQSDAEEHADSLAAAHAAGQAEALGRVDRAAEKADPYDHVILRAKGLSRLYRDEAAFPVNLTQRLLAAAPLEGGTGTGEAGLVGTTASAPESEVLPSTGTARVAVTATVKCDGCGYATEQISPGANIINERCCKCFAGFMRPIGTIFELDLFRERLEWFAATFGTDEEKRSEYVGKHLQDLAAELKTLIDNCREQYVPALAADPEGADARVAAPDGYLIARNPDLIRFLGKLRRGTWSVDYTYDRIVNHFDTKALAADPVQEGRAVADTGDLVGSATQLNRPRALRTPGSRQQRS